MLETGRNTHSALGLLPVVAPFLLGGCLAAPPIPAAGQEWQRAAPGEVGLDGDRLAAFVRDLGEGEFPGVTSLVIVCRGRLVVEEYFEGYDGRKDLHTMQSVSKSFASAILGIAIGEGVIGSVDDRVLDYFPDLDIGNRDARKEAMTVEDLLTMRSGTDYHERGPSSPHSQLNRRRTGWDKFYLDRPMASDPGSRFLYDSGAVIVSSALIEARTGQHADRFGRERLFGKLGIERLRWYRNDEGHPHMGGGLSLRPTDMARFGQMYLDGGRWNGEQVVPAEWVEASFQRHVDLAGRSHDHVIGYGYWWWILEPPTESGGTEPFYAAYGAQGQFIFVVPELDLVVVVTGRTTSYRQESAPMRFMYSRILPAVKSGDSARR